ncbi:MAG: hypothetical protein HZB51_07120 [Chloroflexi bacterium]|nr:hypothetical protein [Chloroflexota bacterium]
MNSIKKFASQLMVDMVSALICLGLAFWMALPRKSEPEPIYEVVRVE